MTPLGGRRAWSWCGLRFYRREGALAMICESDGAADLWLAGRSPLPLSPFADLVTESWDHVAL